MECRYAYLEKQLEAKDANGHKDDGTHKREKREKKDRTRDRDSERERTRDQDRDRKSSKREHRDKSPDRERKRHHSSHDHHRSERDRKHSSRPRSLEKRCAPLVCQMSIMPLEPVKPHKSYLHQVCWRHSEREIAGVREGDE